MSRAALFLLVLLLAPPPLTAQEAWEDDFRSYPIPIEIGTPQGILLAESPGAPGSPIAGNQDTSVMVSGFVESSGTRYYVTPENYEQWIQSQPIRSWIVIPGGGVFPPRPPLLSKSRGIDPDTGEEVEIELYEETVSIEENTTWPTDIPDGPDSVLPVKIDSASASDGGGWRASLTVLPSFDSDTSRLGIANPSFNQLGDPSSQVLRRLISKPDRRYIGLSGTGQAERVLRVLQPGVVFLGRFHSGKLYLLEAGDTFSVPTSSLSPPQFQSILGTMAFRFHIATLGGNQATIAVAPDKVSGADFTNYAMIGDMGPPFDDLTGMPEWTMSYWSVELHADQTIHVVAPLMDGRGAPGSLELESLSLGPTYEEDIAALKDLPAQQPTNLPADPAWKSILQTKLGSVPEIQRVEESEPWGGGGAP